MRRRDFIKTIAGSAAFWPLTARAQQPLPVIGFLSSASPDEYAVRLRTFRQGLQETGYVEGQNVAIEYRWAHTDNTRLPELAGKRKVILKTPKKRLIFWIPIVKLS